MIQAVKEASEFPVVSVVMSVYNGARLLRPAIESILEQSYTDFEFIIIDDGSIDDSVEMIKRYDDQRIVRMSNPSNRGLSFSLNRGISVAQGKFIARQDADDKSHPDRFSRQVEFLDTNQEIGLVGTGSKWIDDHGSLIRTWNPPTDPAEIQQKILRALPVLHATIMFRRSSLDSIEGLYDEDYPVAQDTDFLFRFSEVFDVSNVSDPLYIVRQHGDSTTARRGKEQQKYLKKAQINAIKRRLSYGWSYAGLSRDEIPEWVRNANRRWLSERYVWWSACARAHSKSSALQLLLIAFLLDPTTPDLRQFIRGIVKRKMRITKPPDNQSWFA